MERLTYRRESDKAAYLNGMTAQNAPEVVQKATELLCCYEDTGLEPEEIEEAKARMDAKFMLWVTKAYGLADGRLHDILQAEKDGRLVVLPCKVGDTVYFKTYTKNATICLGIQPHAVHSMRVYAVVDGEFADVELPTVQFGKTVFLTRQEAEGALRKEADNG